MPWIKKLRVGIDYILKSVQFICTWRMVEKNNNYNKWENYMKTILKQNRNSEKNWYPYLLKNIVLFSHKIVRSLEEKKRKSALLKKQNNKQQKKCKLIFSKTVIQTKKKSHDTIQWLRFVVHYLNMKIKGKLVEIVYLKPFSSLKWDHV